MPILQLYLFVGAMFGIACTIGIGRTLGWEAEEWADALAFALLITVCWLPFGLWRAAGGCGK